ncbi:Transmembrane BAX inhibitor motif-containing protein 4 [Perkinsus olseni]|uniref:Transmembrane BAX inhibitor motif-containing protein 4 n=1 Tax=Perkinsus olseni TaxID=32597 RepID=A0A7J6Q5Q9_PEROL|nr:Transmembrane BAX inhibitor motif-containing protein 4 [Perkinsus olseni]
MEAGGARAAGNNSATNPGYYVYGDDIFYDNDNKLLMNAGVDMRMGFIKKVYGILAVQLLVTFGITLCMGMLLPTMFIYNNSWLFILTCVVTCGISIALACSPGLCRSYPHNYIALGIFTVCEGIMLGFITSIYTISSLLLTVGITCLVMGGLTIFAMTTKRDFTTGLMPYLFAGVLTLLLFGLLLMIFHPKGSSYWYAVYGGLGALVFSAYIVFDTQLICGRGEHLGMDFTIDDYVIAALSIYLDVINLFLYLLQLFGSTQDN